MRLEKIILVLLASLLLTNCANRSHTGAVLGSTTTTGTCVSMGIENPYAIAGCAVVGAFAGAEIMYKSDYDVHNAVFVDHLNGDQGTPLIQLLFANEYLVTDHAKHPLQKHTPLKSAIIQNRDNLGFSHKMRVHDIAFHQKPNCVVGLYGLQTQG